jgi:hypothetical protein
MSRWWTEFVARISDTIALPLLLLILFVGAAILAMLWYWFPAWVPRRLPRWHWPRLRWPRWRPRWPRWQLRLRWPRFRWPRLRLRWPKLRWPWRRRTKKQPQPVAEPMEVAVVDDELPDLPVVAFTSLADRLAAEGRYAEAIRERLRAIVRDLVDQRVIEHRPGWTVTELAIAAAQARPAVAGPLDAAARVFSDIWYGQRPASAEHDASMRQYMAEVGQASRGHTVSGGVR